MARPKDTYANVAEIRVTDTGSGAGATEWAELQTGISLGQGTGIIIDALEYSLTLPLLQAMDNDGDYITVGWATSNSIEIDGVNQKQIIHRWSKYRIDAGTAANAEFVDVPVKFDFFPSIILAAPRLYAGIVNNLGGNYTVDFRIYFRYVDLTTQEYLELAEAFVLVG